MRIVLRHFKDSFAPAGLPDKPWPDKPRVPHGEAGLTLIEMLIVLVIIGIVAGLVVVNVVNRPDEARVTVVKTDMKTIGSALAMYRLDNGDYPTTEQGLKALAERPTAAPVPAAWRAYVQQEPTDPWGKPYVYSAGGGTYEIRTLGKDGKPGGEGVDADIAEKGQ